MQTDKPIIVPNSALPPMAATAIQYVVTALGGVLITKGFLPADSDINMLVGVVLMLASAGYGIYKTRRNVAKQQTMEPYVPDQVATTASKEDAL